MHTSSNRLLLIAAATVAIAGLAAPSLAGTLSSLTVTNGAHHGQRGNVNNTTTSVLPAASGTVRWITVTGTVTSSSTEAFARNLRVQPTGGAQLATGPGTPKGQGYINLANESAFTTVNVNTTVAVPGGINAGVTLALENYSADSEGSVPGLDGRSTLTYTFLDAAPAGSAEFRGALAATDPKYARYTNFNADPAGPVVPGYSGIGTAVYYDVVPFSVSADGAYALAIAASFDTHLALYSGGFDPANGAANFIDANDEGRNTLRRAGLASLDVSNDTNGISRLDKNLVAGVQYYAVISSYANNTVGDYFGQFAGTGAVVTGVLPEPTLIAAIGGLGVMTRRRRQRRV